MGRLVLLGLCVILLAGVSDQRAFAQDGVNRLRIEWEVKSRFRLFRSESDFLRHVSVHRDDGILGDEDRLARDSDGRGWARDTVERLCTDRAGRLLESCDRDGVRENYLSPADHPISVVVAGAGASSLTCVWSFDLGEATPREVTSPCTQEVKLRVPYGHPTLAVVDVVLADGTAQRVIADIAVRDVLIAGLGDSIAAGEGNPDRAVRLSDIGFCFRRFLGGDFGEYWRPGRDGFSGNKSCSSETEANTVSDNWARQSARWQSAVCHRSLYGYQMRTALGLAVENPHVAVTFVPLACSGATIAAGFFGSQPIRECPSPGADARCSGSTSAQLAELTAVLTAARRARPDRALDLVLLTIGANDVLFAGLVANVIIQATTERSVVGRAHIASVADAQKILDGNLPNDFARLRSALKPFVGGDLSRVVFVSYANPALSAPGVPCAGGRDGFDVHPAFGVDGARARQVTDFVAQQFLPKIKALATCQSGSGCREGATERMTFVDSHQIVFATHGVCTRSDDDPDFDRECFSAKGESFNTNPAVAATDPLVCGRQASEYRPYAPRQRWVRTANDSYFTAMTYPQGLSLTMQPANIHDATWGILSAVYGGAIHPTAEGHAAMANAALPAVREVLGISGPQPTIQVEPLVPPTRSVPDPRATR